MTGAQLLQFVVSGLTLGCIYALVALGFTIIFNSSGIVNFAQGDFVMLSALFAASLSSFAVPLPVAVLLAVIGTAAVGGIMERVLIRSLPNDPSLFTAVMMTMGASIVFNAITLLVWGADPLHLQAFSGEIPVRIYGATIVPQMLWIGGGLAVVMAGLGLFFRYTWLGQGMLACAMNRDAAAALGVDVRAMVSMSFIGSAAIGGLGGALIAPITMATHDMGGPMTLKGFTAAIIGGLGSVPGAVLGGLLLGLFESLSSGIVSSGYRDAIALGLLIIVLMVRPSGITGTKLLKR
jgi:branched-chain amino acid transport system permease protein